MPSHVRPRRCRGCAACHPAGTARCIPRRHRNRPLDPSVSIPPLPFLTPAPPSLPQSLLALDSSPYQSLYPGAVFSAGSVRPRISPAESMARPRLAALALIVVSVTLLPPVSSDHDYRHCEGVVKGWANSFAENEKDEDKFSLKDFAFLPSHSLDQWAYLLSLEWPRSCDRLRFNPT